MLECRRDGLGPWEKIKRKRFEIKDPNGAQGIDGKGVKMELREGAYATMALESHNCSSGSCVCDLSGHRKS